MADENITTPGPIGAQDPTAGTAAYVNVEPNATEALIAPAVVSVPVVPGVQADGSAVLSPEAHQESAEHLEALRSTLDKPKNEWEKIKTDIALALDRLEVLLHLK